MVWAVIQLMPPATGNFGMGNLLLGDLGDGKDRLSRELGQASSINLQPCSLSAILRTGIRNHIENM